MEEENSIVSIIVGTKDRPELLKGALQAVADQSRMEKIPSVRRLPTKYNKPEMSRSEDS